MAATMATCQENLNLFAVPHHRMKNLLVETNAQVIKPSDSTISGRFGPQSLSKQGKECLASYIIRCHIRIVSRVT